LTYILAELIIIYMARYVRNVKAIFNLKLHLIWCTKYRRPVLVEDIEKRLRILLYTKTKELEMVIYSLDINPDYVHIFIEFDPRQGIAEIVNRLKGFTSRILRREFSSLRSRLPTLWSRSYYAGTVGQVLGVTIRMYIDSQKGK